MFNQFGAADHPALMHHHIMQQAVFEGGQSKGLAIDGRPRGARIKPQSAAGQGRGGMARGSPQQRSQPRQQLLCMKRLGQIVIGAGVESGDLFTPGAAGGENQHRRRLAVPAPALKHRNPVDLW